MQHTFIVFPRSGSHLVRYIIEYCTLQATSEKHGTFKRAIASKEEIKLLNNVETVRGNSSADFMHFTTARGFYRKDIEDKHQFKPNFKHVEKLGLIIRNPIETYISHYNDDIENPNNILEFNNTMFENFNFFQTFDGEKNIIYYENLINSNPKIYTKEIEKIHELVSFKKHLLEEMLSKWFQIKNDALHSLERKAVSGEDILFYSKNTDKKTLQHIQEKLKELMVHPYCDVYKSN